jgi:hypothetical protein
MAHFLEDHLGRWTVAFEVALQEANAAAPYALLAKLLRKAIAADCMQLGVKPRPARRGTARDPLEADRFVCPLAGQDPVKKRPAVAAQSPQPYRPERWRVEHSTYG